MSWEANYEDHQTQLFPILLKDMEEKCINMNSLDSSFFLMQVALKQFVILKKYTFCIQQYQQKQRG